MIKKNIELNIDGKIKKFEVNASTRLIEVLKEAGYRGLRQACDGGNCGGCTVIIDKKPVLSCLILAVQSVKREILTIDGVINYDSELKLLPLSFKRAGSSQCGFCTCGFIMSTAGLYFENRNPDKDTLIKQLSGNLCRCTGYEKIIKGAELFFDIINNRKSIDFNTYEFETEPFGKPIDKIDGDGLTQGKSLYTSDMIFPGQYYMKLALSNTAHGIIKNIDTSKAEQLAGVKLVLTYKNTPKIKYTSAAQGYPEPSPYDTMMFDDKVRFYGEPVAAVVAENLKIAESAVKLIKIEYEELPVILNFEDSYINPKFQIHNDKKITNIEDPEKNLTASFHYEQGKINWENIPVIVENNFETSKQQHCHLEPHTAIAFKDEYGRINIYSSTQVPFDVRRVVAGILKLPFSKVRIIKPRIGGGFGGKQEILIEHYAAFAASILDKPVKILMTRKEEFTFARTRHPFKTNLKLGFSNSGKLLNLEADMISDTGAYGGHGSTVAELAIMRIMSLYPAPNIKTDIKVIYTNKTPAGAFRGYGEPQIMFAIESLFDEAAKKLNISPDKLRSLNHIKKGDRLQVETLFVKPFPKGEIVNVCELPNLINQGKKLIEFEKRRKHHDKNIVTGKGMAISMQGSGIANITRSSVTVSLNEDGSIQLMTGAVDVGTGADTVLTQIAGQTLSLPVDKIHIITSDTAVTPYDSGAYASNTTYFAGEAVRQACEKLKLQIISWVSKKFEIDESKLFLKNSKIITDNKSFGLDYISRLIFADLKPVETVFSVTVKKENSAPPFVATFADIDVNIKTGKIKVVNIVQVLDCGKIVNPVLAEGQIEGTTMQALGYTLYENMNYTKSGKIIETDLLSYKIPTIFEKPGIKVLFIESHEPTGPYGLKAVGEVAYASVVPAVNNALYDALGFHIYSLPITPEKVLNSLNNAG
ncbi:molybdopterin-dependent oxidoreductase [Candidatus Dependentiae bacterium]|nr:molybdopterin-dependent oxidoreductase [Candidatus Dependentiae bacterium]